MLLRLGAGVRISRGSSQQSPRLDRRVWTAPQIGEAARRRGKHFIRCRTDWLLFKLQVSGEDMKESALKSSVDYRSCPTGQDVEEKGEKTREVDECARARSIDQRALKSKDPSAW